jgi:ligand-binding sensor domain-containing protein
VYRYNAITNTFTHFTTRDGLLSDNVSSVMQDRAGIFWISTAAGISRYDGKSFTEFAPNEKCAFTIELLMEDSKENFWFATAGYGICRYNSATSAFTNFTKEDGLESNMVQCMLEDKAGNLWVGERAGGVCLFDSASGRFTKVSQPCLSSQIMGILQDKTGNIWFANLYDGLCRYEPSSGKYTHLTQADGLCHNFVTCIYEDRKGTIWFGSSAGNWNTGGGGLCGYDGKSFTRFTEKDGITKFEVWTIVEDNDGNIWVGTKGGLYRYHSPSGKFIDYTFRVSSSGN